MGYVTLVNPNVMRKLDGMNIIIQLKLQNHQNTFEATSTTILLGLSFQMLQKMLRLGSLTFWKPDLNEQKDSKRLVLFRNGVT